MSHLTSQEAIYLKGIEYPIFKLIFVLLYRDYISKIKILLVIFYNITVEKAAQIAHAAAFANGGQCCCAGTRTFVQSGIYDLFVSKAAEIAKKRSVGNPFDDVQQGPQVIYILYKYLHTFFSLFI